VADGFEEQSSGCIPLLEADWVNLLRKEANHRKAAKIQMQ